MTECEAGFHDQLPDVAAGRADASRRAAVLAHVGSCARCAGDLRLLEALHAGRPRLSAEMAERIGRGVRGGLAAAPGTARTRRWIPGWALAAAAVAGLALGTPALMERMGSGAGVPEAGLDDLDLAGLNWISEDPVVAGAPVLESLTDEQLARLLEELDG